MSQPEARRATPSWLRELRSVDGRFRFLASPGIWFWTLLLLGALIRCYLVVFTEGSDDVRFWTVHARWTHLHGIVSFYERSESSNHPPFIVQALAALWGLEEAWGVPFRISLRAPFALLDLANALLLLRLLRGVRARFAAFAAYWVSPLAMIFSAYHGNTDTAVAFFALLAALAVVAGRPLLAGVAVGVGLWVKLPVILFAPALFFAFASWRSRIGFVASAAAVATAGYLPALLAAPELVYRRVIAYPGLVVSTGGGAPIWGVWNLMGAATRMPATLGAAADFHLVHNTALTLVPILLLAWLRRGRATAMELGWTLAGSLLLFYGISMRLSFQYFAWGVPFWIFAGAGIYALASLVIGAYVYATYAYVCDSALLMGRWRWDAHPFFNDEILLLRDLSVLLCLGLGLAALVRAGRAEWLRRRERA